MGSGATCGWMASEERSVASEDWMSPSVSASSCSRSTSANSLHVGSKQNTQHTQHDTHAQHTAHDEHVCTSTRPGREAGGGVTQNERLPRLAGIEKRQRPSHAQQRRPPHRRLAGPHAREPLRQLVTRIRGDEWSARGLMRGGLPRQKVMMGGRTRLRRVGRVKSCRLPLRPPAATCESGGGGCC